MARGRKRKIAPRHKCGKLVQPEAAERAAGMRDRGTPEIQQQRFAIYGTAEPGDEVTPRELICPLAPIRHLMDQDQEWAARHAIRVYQRYASAIGMPRLKSGNLSDYVEGSRSNPMPIEDRQKAADQYADMIHAASRYSRRGLVHLQRLMHGTPPRHRGELEILLLTLRALADHWGMREKRAA